MLTWWKFILALIFLASPSAYAKQAQKHLHIIWLMNNDNPFWKMSQNIVLEAAKDLSIKTSMLLATPDDRLSATKLAEEALNQLKKDPETSYYLAMFGSYFGADKVLKLAEEKQVPVFIFNSTLPFAFQPRQGLTKGVIGALLPDDEEAGYLEAKRLFADAKKSKTSPLPLHVLALGSWNRDTVGEARRAGLIRAAKEDGVIVDQYFYTRWRADVAKDQMLRALQKFPNTNIVWTVADYLGLVALEAAGPKKSSLLVGGIDWSPEGLASLKHDQGLRLSIGGHFMEPAWVTALIYDYHNGLDFVQLYPNLILRSQMSSLDRSTVNDFFKRNTENDWSRIDYKSFTRTFSKKHNYDFSLSSFLR